MYRILSLYFIIFMFILNLNANDLTKSDTQPNQITQHYDSTKNLDNSYNDCDHIVTISDSFQLIILIILILIIFLLFITISNKKLKKETKNKEHLYKKLEEQNEEISLFKNVIDNVKVGVTISKLDDNNQHKIIYINDTFEQLTGYTKEEIIGKNLKLLQGKDRKQEEIALMKKAISDEEYCEVEIRNYKKDGTMFYNFVNLSPIFDHGGKLIHYIGIIHDITESKEKEKQYIQQSKLASMGEMIGNIAHQWRQPLSVISTGATGIKAKHEYDILDDKFLIATCEHINENAQYLSQTIEYFGNYIKGDTQSIRFDLKNDTKSFLNIIDSTIKKHHINIILDLKEHVSVQGYPNELIQGFINIFNNSKDALIQNNGIYDRYIFISHEIIDNNIIIKFKDNGGGIGADIIDKVFEPYFTTKHKSQGTGLGLPITYNYIVNSMKGKIEAKNVEFKFHNKTNKGVEFIITIPLSE